MVQGVLGVSLGGEGIKKGREEEREEREGGGKGGRGGEGRRKKI